MLALASLALRPKQKERRRHRIYEAALKLTRERGFEGFTMADVAAAAEVSRATVFNYFASKDDFLVEYHREMTRSALAAEPDAGHSGLANVEALLQRMCALAESNRPVARAIVSRIFVSDRLQQVDGEDETDLLQWLVEALDHARQVGELAEEIDTPILARILVALLSAGAIEWATTGARGSLWALIEPQVSLLLARFRRHR